MTLFDLYTLAKADRYVQDKHTAYKIGEIAEWKDGPHQKTAHGWVKVKEERDRRGNLIGECKSLSKLTEHQFTHPVCSLKLPAITNNVWNESVGDDRQVLLKKNVIERMNRDHKEIKNNGLNHRDVFLNAIYHCDKILHCKPQEEPYYYAAVRKANSETIKIYTHNCVSILDINPDNKYIEVVDWRWIGKHGLKSMEKQEKRNTAQ